MDKLFSLFPIERVARSWSRGGFYDEDFDESLLPFEVVEDVWIEDITSLVSDDEFEIYKQQLGTITIAHLERLKYVAIHRFTRNYFDLSANKSIFEPERVQHSERLIQEVVACLRLIRPTIYHAQLCGGSISEDGKLRGFRFHNPLEFFTPLENQKFFAIRTQDIEDLRIYAPLFRQAMAGDFWKYRMAVDMFQSGYFQQSHWKARYFLWTAALEALFTSQGGPQHRGSLVAKERVKFILGENRLIYPPGELTSLDPSTPLTVAEIIDEIYCLRNDIAHGDKLPDYYYQATGRTSFENTMISKVDALLEAISSIVRQCLLTILKKNLLIHFKDAQSSEAYFSANGLTKSEIEKSLKAKGNITIYQCPK
jgi:hypothetical protein